MPRSTWNGARWSAAVITIILLSGCGAGAEAAPEFADGAATAQLDEAISDVAVNGGSVPLSEVAEAAGIEWDEAALFAEGTPISEIEGVVGETGLFGADYVASPYLLVFRSEGAVSGLVKSSSDAIDGRFGELLGADAALVLRNGDSGPVVLKAGG